MFKKIFNYIKDTIKEEYKFILLLISTTIIFTWPLNYYIVVGGGISNIDSRIEVEDGYSSKGSFNISYVTELEGRVATYLLSYIIPDWKRVSADQYKYDEDENLEDIEFRNNLDLAAANSRAIKYAYQLAGKKYEVTSSKIYVTSVPTGLDCSLKIRDQILSINDQSFQDIESYKDYLQEFEEGEKVNVKVLRDEEEKVIKSTLYKAGERLVLGVTLQVVKDFETDPKIEINFKKRESGPSGGLITTLDIYNKLTEEDLTKNLKIAGTGTIEEDGTIGEIGEVKYKLLGAVKEDADVFIVPNGANYKTCIKVKKEKKLDIKIIGVSTIQEAIEELEKL